MLDYFGHYDVELYYMECDGIVNVKDMCLCLQRGDYILKTNLYS